MARKPRLYCDSGFYHLILRGNNKQNLFNCDEDRTFFITKLKKFSNELDIDVHAFCLMNNHVHILIGNAGRNMGLLVQKLANSYVFYFNRKYDRCGHLFQGRYKSEPILDEAYFKIVYRYILQNCEKGGLEKVNLYKWNSFSALMNLNKNSFIKTEYIIGLFGSRSLLLEFILEPEIHKCMEYENRIVFSDDRAFNFIKKIFRISSPYKLERLSVDEQIQKCKIMKNHGISKSQIARITGISKAIIRTV